MNHPIVGTLWLCRNGEGVGFEHTVLEVANGMVITWSAPGNLTGGWTFYGTVEAFVKQFMPIKKKP